VSKHELGARTLADVFEFHGWRTSFLGANLPTRELLAMIKQGAHPPDLIALSATMPAHLPRLASHHRLPSATIRTSRS